MSVEWVYFNYAEIGIKILYVNKYMLYIREMKSRIRWHYETFYIQRPKASDGESFSYQCQHILALNIMRSLKKCVHVTSPICAVIWFTTVPIQANKQIELITFAKFNTWFLIQIGKQQ